LKEANVTDEFDIRYSQDPTEEPFEQLSKWMLQDDVIQAMHVQGHKWVGGDRAYYKLSSDESQSARFLVPGILKKIPLLLYEGYYDPSCNWMGVLDWCSTMEWDGQDSFSIAKNVTWSVDGEVAGYYRTALGLTFLVVDNAGHMSPFDQPRNTQSMLNSFLSGSLFSRP